MVFIFINLHQVESLIVQVCRTSSKLLRTHQNGKISKLYTGWIYYIFTSLFYKSKGEHLQNKEKCILFHFESSFCSWDNQVLTFQILNVWTSSNAQAWSTKEISLNNLESKLNLCNIKKEIFYQKTVWKMWPGN